MAQAGGTEGPSALRKRQEATLRPEGLFVIDAEQRIVEWHDGAAGATGVSASVALGQPCWEVVRGCDPLGHPICRRGCPAFAELQGGRLRAQCRLIVPGAGQPCSALRCELVALPGAGGDGLGGALVRLIPRGPAYRAVATPEQSGARLGAASNVLCDLPSLAMVTALLATGPFQQRLGRALDLLLQATRAEAAEMFLAEPGAKGMDLAIHCGLFPRDFRQIPHFQPGEGYPGLVLLQRAPILTRSLAEDPRYLRSRVKERGFQSYLCVPLFASERVLGSLNLASRRPDFDLEGALRLLLWVSMPLSLAVQAAPGVYDAASLLAVFTDVGREEGGEHLLRHILRRLIDLGRAEGGSLHLLHASGGVAWQVWEGAAAVAGCPGLEPGATPCCPALDRGYGMALHGPPAFWPEPCRHAGHRGRVTYCLPLLSGSGAIGLARTWWQKASPRPPTRDLGILQAMAQNAVPLLLVVRDYREAQRRSEVAFQRWRQGDGAALGLAGPPLSSHPEVGATYAVRDDTPEPYLDIRCFGPFELRRQGLIITPEKVQRRKALTLLQILLTYDGRPVPKETLMELLWPEVDPKAGAMRLWVTVHALRQLVEPPGPRRTWVFIKSEGDRYYFAREAPCYVDVREFQDLVKKGRGFEARGDSEGAIATYEAAARLYRGDFLEDEPFAEWCWMEREHLREIYLELRQGVATLHAQGSAWGPAITHLRLALRGDPLREETHRELMRCLWAAGRRDEALRQYQVCQDLLSRELDIEPLAETERLAHLIRSSP